VASYVWTTEHYLETADGAYTHVYRRQVRWEDRSTGQPVEELAEVERLEAALLASDTAALARRLLALADAAPEQPAPAPVRTVTPAQRTADGTRWRVLKPTVAPLPSRPTFLRLPEPGTPPPAGAGPRAAAEIKGDLEEVRRRLSTWARCAACGELLFREHEVERGWHQACRPADAGRED
jgi:hypothetical protein